MTIQFDFWTHQKHHYIMRDVLRQIALTTQPVEGVSDYVHKNYQTLFKDVVLDRIRYDTNEVVLEVQWGKRKKTYDLIVPISAIEVRVVETLRRLRLTEHLSVPVPPSIEEDTRKATLRGWMHLQEWSTSLKCPKASLDEEWGFLVWEDGEVYSELEFVDGQVEYFTKTKDDAEATRKAVDFPDIEAFLNSPEAQELLSAHSLDPIDPIGHTLVLVTKASTPSLDAPCPHPERKGHHELYIDGDLRSEYCRACGAKS